MCTLYSKMHVTDLAEAFCSLIDQVSVPSPSVFPLFSLDRELSVRYRVRNGRQSTAKPLYGRDW